ncbi:hypothetical protein J8273_5002 [Carpediemonas membranifera]|uniref:Uncharacterized protein n=1 Tax=Carpediemonas membranifera TaxID=201153 RepID=A0A8J6BXI2_9EUKA|nr:hypothetical protein J8273_5002 [Carpediemonas membranifera]|eukprot:KAG9393516.1 hypothetical protein J8273_5002 [Carpediemonas membranifera]
MKTIAIPAINDDDKNTPKSLSLADYETFMDLSKLSDEQKKKFLSLKTKTPDSTYSGEEFDTAGIHKDRKLHITQQDSLMGLSVGQGMFSSQAVQVGEVIGIYCGHVITTSDSHGDFDFLIDKTDFLREC